VTEIEQTSRARRTIESPETPHRAENAKFETGCQRSCGEIGEVQRAWASPHKMNTGEPGSRKSLIEKKSTTTWR